MYIYIYMLINGRIKEFGDYEYSFFYFVYLHLYIEQTPCNDEIMAKA